MRLLRLFPALALAAVLHADVTLPGVLAEHMVLQRGVPVHLWGKAAPGETVSAAFRGVAQTAKADGLGKWSLYLPPGDGGGPFALRITAGNTISFDDVLVGEVWVASGQSNMELQLRRASNPEAEIAAANYPKIRRTKINRKSSDYALDDASVAPWTAITPQNAAEASAAAYFFARHLQEKLGGVPIGIIESFWGGTNVEAWTSLRALSEDPALMPVFSRWAGITENYQAQLQRYELGLAQWSDESAKARGAGKPDPRKPVAPTNGPGGQNTPAGLYNGMIAPIVGYTIKGAIWYQGEGNANAAQVGLYARNFQAMIRDWRRAWGVGDFPFLYVQLPNYTANTYWPELREAQRQTLALVNTGMAITIDAGLADNLHPPNKQDVGLRLAIAARGLAYGEKITYSGPLFRQVSRDGNGLRVWFDQVGGGLQAKGGGAVRGFEVAGTDKKFVPAEARIEGGAVVVASGAVAEPVYVRYGWADSPDCNLFNAEGLPASPFRSF